MERLESYHGVRKDISIRAFGRENIRFRGRTEIGFKFESREFNKYEVVHEQSYIKKYSHLDCRGILCKPITYMRDPFLARMPHQN